MKFIIASIFSILQFLALQAQTNADSAKAGYVIDDNGNVTIEEIVELPGRTKTDLFLSAQKYISSTYGDANEVVQVADSENGLLIGKGLYKEGSKGYNLKFGSWHIIKVETKDGKARIAVSLTEYEIRMVGNLKSLKVAENYPINKNGQKKKEFEKHFEYNLQNALGTIDGIKKQMMKDKDF